MAIELAVLYLGDVAATNLSLGLVILLSGPSAGDYCGQYYGGWQR